MVENTSFHTHYIGRKFVLSSLSEIVIL